MLSNKFGISVSEYKKEEEAEAESMQDRWLKEC